MQEYAEVWQKLPTVYKKSIKCIGNNSWLSSPRVTFNLTCRMGVTELQNLTNLHYPLQKVTRCNRTILTSPLTTGDCDSVSPQTSIVARPTCWRLVTVGDITQQSQEPSAVNIQWWILTSPIRFWVQLLFIWSSCIHADRSWSSSLCTCTGLRLDIVVSLDILLSSDVHLYRYLFFRHLSTIPAEQDMLQHFTAFCIWFMYSLLYIYSDITCNMKNKEIMLHIKPSYYISPYLSFCSMKTHWRSSLVRPFLT